MLKRLASPLASCLLLALPALASCLLLAPPAMAQSSLPLPAEPARPVEPALPADAALRSPSLAEVAERWAPDLYQDTDDSNTSADLITALDFDGDRDMTNNWEAMERFSEVELRRQGTLYWWGSRTATHDFVGYAYYHPRDWVDGGFLNRARGVIGPRIGVGSGEHENDFEGVLLVINRATGEPQLLVTQAHDQFYQYGPAKLWRDRGREDIDGPILRDPDTGRVQVYIEAKGHGAYGSPAKTDFRAQSGDGVLYTRAGSAINARDGAHAVGYRLESMTPWYRRFLAVPDGEADETFSRRGRPSLRGDNKDDDAAQPPWGWKDNDYPSYVSPLFWSDPARFVTWMFEPTAPFSRSVQQRSYERARSLRGFAGALARLLRLARVRLTLRKRLRPSPRAAAGVSGSLARRLR